MAASRRTAPPAAAADATSAVPDVDVEQPHAEQAGDGQREPAAGWYRYRGGITRDYLFAGHAPVHAVDGEHSWLPDDPGDGWWEPTPDYVPPSPAEPSLAADEHQTAPTSEGN